MTDKPVLDITMGKRVAHRTHGNAGPITGDMGALTLGPSVPSGAVRVCETPEFFALHGCLHGRTRKYKDEEETHEDPDV